MQTIIDSQTFETLQAAFSNTNTNKSSAYAYLSNVVNDIQEIIAKQNLNIFFENFEAHREYASHTTIIYFRFSNVRTKRNYVQATFLSDENLPRISTLDMALQILKDVQDTMDNEILQGTI